MKRLEGRRAVVTGGGSGIGKASALRLAREGASVLVVGRSANTEETVEAIKAASSFGLAHTTVRIEPIRVATMLLSGSVPMRAAISTRSSIR